MARNPNLRITEKDGVRTLKFAHAHQSSMRLDDPYATDFAYPRYLHLAVAVVPDARRTLVIGLGGGTVVKQLWRDHPAMAIDAVEIDAEVAEAARTHFALPDDERIRVVIGDGRAYLEGPGEPFDVVIVDAFDDDRVPPHLLTQQFALLARARMPEGGALAINFHGSTTGDRSKPFRALYRTLGSVFRHVWVFPVGLSEGGGAGEHREIIVLATDAALTTDELLTRIANRVDGRVTVDGFDSLGAELLTGGIRAGDVGVLLDPRR